MWYLIFSGAQKRAMCKNMSITNLSKLIIIFKIICINNRMFLYSGDANQQTVSSKLKKLTLNQVFRLLMEMRNYTQCWVKSMHHKIHDRW